jgi:nucleotide-binding universal stress UspA family protein
MKDSNIILVPTDFSAVAECATNHAIKIATTLKGEIALLHVISKEKELDFAKERLQRIADEIMGKHNIKATPIARIGNIFEDIGEVAAEISAKLIIMGTHGMKGLQFITGSHALKVITSSQVPFIVVQEKPIKHGYSDIVLPMDLSKDTKQKLALTVMMAKNFKSTVHVIIPSEDDEFLLNTINRNLSFTKKNLEENGITYTVKTAEGGNFTKQIIKYAVSIDADLIAIMNEEAGSDEQAIIANEPQIPVLCMNPTRVTVARGIFAS